MKRARRGFKLKRKTSSVEVVNEDKSSKLQKIRKLVSPGINYTKLKYKDEIYSLGDILMIRDVNDGFLVAELVKIVVSGGNKKYSHWPTVQVQWYYKKSDINREKNGLTNDTIFNSISEFELFKSTHTDIIFIETIVSQCKICTYEEYENLEEHTQFTFFCRASYDPNKELIDPSFDTWEKSCECRTPLNPDQLYIKCDKCDEWFHPICCGVEESKLEKLSQFYCKSCINS